MSDYSPGDLKNDNGEVIAEQEIVRDLIISIYPNPAGSYTTIEFDCDETQPVELYITDVTGRVMNWMLEQEMPETPHYKADINTVDFANGMYLCILKSGGETRVQKFMVQH